MLCVINIIPMSHGYDNNNWTYELNLYMSGESHS